MIKILEKLAMARVFIKSHPIKKDGRNDYSKYDYFTPEIVSKLVNDACVECNIICVFSLRQDSLGYFGEITTTCLETGESIVTEMRTAKPVITATNETQQMGGMNTYTKRYCFMSLFDIEDNTIDFDSQDNSKKSTQQSNPQAPVPAVDLPWLNKTLKSGELTKEWQQVTGALKQGARTIEQIKKAFKISKENMVELSAIVKS